jgi:cell division protein FtsB
MGIETYILGSLVGLVCYFLKSTIDDLKRVKETAYETKNKLAVLENDYLNKHNALSEKFDALCDSVKDLTNEIKLLNKEFNKKKD